MGETSTTIDVPIGKPASASPIGHRGRRYQRRLLGRFALIGADLLLIQAVTLLVGIELLPFQWAATAHGIWTPGLGAAAALAVLIPSMGFGLYDAAGLSPLDRFRKRVIVGLMLPWLGLAPLAVAQPVTLEAIFALCVVAVLFVPIGLLAEAAVRRLLIAKAAWGADVVIIGSGDAAARIADALLANPDAGLRPIGYCGNPPDSNAGMPVVRLGSLGDVGGLAGAADAAVVAISPETPALDLAKLPFSRIIVIPHTAGVPEVRLKTCAMGGIAGFDFANPARARSHMVAKRVLDLLVAVPALVLALPVIGALALAVRLASPGRAIYVQPRVGWNGRRIPIFKLRSMYIDAEERLKELLRTDPAANAEWRTYMKLKNDPRILPVVGNFIRKTSLDELPQLWNVVRGDISLVGPRPFPAYHVEQFSPEFQQLRHSVRPGLTGLWQVSARNDADLRQQEAIDSFYIQNWSLWLDFYILFRTLPAVIGGRGI